MRMQMHRCCCYEKPPIVNWSNRGAERKHELRGHHTTTRIGISPSDTHPSVTGMGMEPWRERRKVEAGADVGAGAEVEAGAEAEAEVEAEAETETNAADDAKSVAARSHPAPAPVSSASVGGCA